MNSDKIGAVLVVGGGIAGIQSSLNAAAMRAVTLLSKERLEHVPITAVVNERRCIGCGVCVEVCDYNARLINEETRKAEVIEALCQGCGACVAACPSQASQQKGFEKRHLIAMLEAIS